MIHRIIITGKANTISAQIAYVRERLQPTPPIRSGGPFDGRAIDRDALEQEKRQAVITQIGAQL